MSAETAKIIRFRQRPKKRTKIIREPGFKYFNQDQIKTIRRAVRDASELAATKNTVTAVREWMAIDLLTSTGLRVSECANLRCGDLKVGYGECELFVRIGKGKKSRTVQIPESLKKHLKTYLVWKRERSEETGEDDFMFMGQRGPMTHQAIQGIVKKWLKALGLYEKGKSVHSLRHSYAVEVYRRNKDLRAVQKQLGHSSIVTTQIYADVLKEDIQDQIKNIWN